MKRVLVASVIMFAAIGSMAAVEYGISKDYLGDNGIENDADVVFAADFEESSVTAAISDFKAIKEEGMMDLVADVHSKSSGGKAIELKAIGGQNTGSHLFTGLSGWEQLYVRCYIKWATDGSYHHSGLRMCGYNPPQNGPSGGAGTRPDGNQKFSVALEPSFNDSRMDFYSYWCQMHASNDGAYWGNSFINPILGTTFNGVELAVDPTRWVCVEYMIKMNTPRSGYGGELQLWIDGEEVIHLKTGSPEGKWSYDSFIPNGSRTPVPFEGFQWATTTALKVNQIGLQQYVTLDADGFVSKILFDDLVVAKSYIGPVYDGTAPGIRQVTITPLRNSFVGKVPVRDVFGRRLAVGTARVQIDAQGKRVVLK